ncbi:hypothetical protein EV144_1011189 [Flavobacterium sp. 270]|nr:hypothetical protein [Flavobacterium sp. 270]TDW52499.1 hypothetical protein EV144_1011189 [Flavobacterium sp. 270]
MKIKLTLSQLKKILEKEDLKFPIIFKQSNFTPKQFGELSKLLQNRNRS